MSWFGKSIGAGAGALALGPLGAAAGAVLGHWFDNRNDISDEELIRTQFFSIVVAAARACNPNGGGFSEKQQQHLIKFGEAVFGTTDRGTILHAISVVLGNTPPPQECGQTLAATNEETAHWLMREIISVMHVHPERFQPEMQWIQTVINSAGIPSNVWNYVLAFYEPINFGNARATWLSVLGLTLTATEADIKNAYRSKSREYHPDSNPQASSALKKLGEQKLIEINEAYELLTSGPTNYFLVRCQNDIWRVISGVAATFVGVCPICATLNRTQKATVLQARCGACHARLAQSRELVAMLQN